MKVPERKMMVEQVSCDVCLVEIPPSEAKSVEVHDYVMHFCGLDCYDQWRKQKEPKNKETMDN